MDAHRFSSQMTNSLSLALYRAIFFIILLICFSSPFFVYAAGVQSVHVESNNRVNSAYAVAGDVIKIFITMDPSVAPSAIALIRVGFQSSNNWASFFPVYQEIFSSCGVQTVAGVTCVYEFVVPATGASAPYNPPAGLFDFAIRYFDSVTRVSTIVARSTDGSSVTIDRSPAPALTVSSPSDNAEVNSTFSITGTCTNGLPVNISGSGFTPTSSTATCTSGAYTSETFTTLSNVKINVSQVGSYGVTTTVSRTYTVPSPSYVSTKTWDFSTSGNYTYNASKITVSSGVAQFQKSSVPESTLWTKSSDNPFLSPTQPWEETLVFEPSVIYEDGVFKMWYSGGGATCSTGYATSPDGRTWTKPFNHPIVGSGYGGLSGVACRNNVIKHNGIYYMTVATGTGNGGEKIVLVTSTDGINFSNPRNVLFPSNWNLGIANTNVYIENGTWYLIYDARSLTTPLWKMGIASGPDLEHLTNFTANNPITTLSRSGIYGGAVMHKVGNKYHMWYHASTNGQPVPTTIFHSVSDNLITWRNIPNVVVDITQTSWEVDQTADPFIVEANGKTYMFYDGDDNSGASVIAYIGLVEFDGTLEEHITDVMQPSIQPIISQAQSFSKLYGFTETATKGSNANIYYHVSTDNGATWKYWNGSAWVIPEGIEGSTASDINNNIRTLDTDGGTFLYKAFLYSEGNQVTLDSTALSYSLITDPVLTRIQSRNGGEASLDITAPSQSTAPVADYVIQYKKSSDNTWSTFSHTPSDSSTFTITGLEPGTSYDFRVAAVTAQDQSGYSNIVSTTISNFAAVPLPPSSGASGTATPVISPPQPVVPVITPPVVIPHVPVSSNVCTPYLTGIIRSGSADPVSVGKLQEFLNTYEQANLVVDGTYDIDDISAVKKFQEKYRTEILAPWGFRNGTGIVSVTTMAKINALVCGQTLGCPYFTEYVKAGEVKPEVSKIKAFLNTLDTTIKLDIESNVADEPFINAVKKFQFRYKDFVLKPWNLTRPTGYWYKTTSAKANEFMGCVE